MSETSSELVVNEPRQITYSSMATVTVNDRKRVYNALSTSLTIGDFLNEELAVVDIIAGEVELVNKETGEVDIATRTVLVLDDGTAIAATSGVLYSRLMQITAIFGDPTTWEEPLTMIIKQQNIANGRRIYIPVLV